MSRSGGFVATLVACVLFSAGCTSIGPQTVARDRFDYNGEVARSWKEQILLNIVKSRYLDAPVFLDISQIVSGYTLQSTVSLGGSTAGLGEGFTANAQGVFIDRPTITYTPLTGAQFNRNMLTPIPPSAVLFTMASGWPVDLVFRVAVRSINGVESTGPDAPRYDRLLVLMRDLQRAQVLGMRVRAARQEEQNVVLFFRAGALTPQQETWVQEVRGILGLEPGRSEFNVTFGQVAAASSEISMQTRSMLQILVDLGAFVDVPETDLREGRAPPGATIVNGVGRIHIKYSPERPNDVLSRIAYRDGWFWIDDRDLESKMTFSLVLIFSTLTETGGRESLPLVTIPAG